MLYRPCQIGFPQVQSFANQREAGIRDYRPRLREVFEESSLARFSEAQVSLSPFPIEPITNEGLANSFQNVDEFYRRGSHVNHHGLAFGRNGFENRSAQNRREEKRPLVFRLSAEEGS